MDMPVRSAVGFGRGGAGAWCTDTTSGGVARLARSGFDWVCLDGQHGTFGREELVCAARSFPHDSAALVVRVAHCDFATIGVALDTGATAVIVPQVDSVSDARRAVAATFYPPLGGRSWGQLVRTWGVQSTEPATANARTGLAVMIESASALAVVEDIAAVEGVTQLFVGPYDLSLSLGTTVEELLDDDSPASPLRRIVEAGAAHGRQIGAYAGAPALVKRFRKAGIDCLAVATDVWLMEAGAASALRAAEI